MTYDEIMIQLDDKLRYLQTMEAVLLSQCDTAELHRLKKIAELHASSHGTSTCREKK